jgi:NitT/TauT family transport system substrate-binding protein
VALQSGQVDMIVVDWLWVARQRGAGADWTFVPFSNAVGALIAPAGSPVRDVPDLADRAVGIAGSPLDKSWLILRAYATKRYGIDLDSKVNKSFGPPSLLAEQMRAGRLDALLTYWPFAAKAEAAGARRILAVEDAVSALGIGAGVPYIGYTFAQRWAEQNPALIDGFITASRQARSVLATSDAEWQRLKPMTGAADDAELERLRDWYRRGIPHRWDGAERQAAGQLFDLLASIGGPDLVGPINATPSGTFWPVNWQADA